MLLFCFFLGNSMIYQILLLLRFLALENFEYFIIMHADYKTAPWHHLQNASPIVHENVWMWNVEENLCIFGSVDTKKAQNSKIFEMKLLDTKD